MTREHPRRRPLRNRSVPPMVHLDADPLPPDGDTFTAGGAAELRAALGIDADPVTDSVSRETVSDLAPLPKEAVARLEALTAIWERQVRLEGPADATMLYAAAGSRKPPVPPVRSPDPAPAREDYPAELPPVPTDDEEAAADAAEADQLVHTSQTPAAPPAPAVAEAMPAGRVSAWVSRHDPRSLAYAAQRRLTTPAPLQDLLLEHGPILDQGTMPPLSLHDASACTGFALAAAVNTLELESRPLYTRAADGMLDADVARALYARGQQLDGLSGEDYPGTSILAVMKAGQEAGYFPEYLWALRGTRDVAQVLLQLRCPVVIGIPWGPSLDAPDEFGRIRPDGPLTEGHALAVVGLRMAVGGQPGPWFVLQQSRGPAEGIGGLVFLHHRDLGRLLAGRGEAAVPLHTYGMPEATP